MSRRNINDLIAFRAVAQERSFTRAAAQIGVSTSALSHTIRSLEERLRIRLLTRTTRSVGPTESGRTIAWRDRSAPRRHRGGACRAKHVARQAWGERSHHDGNSCCRDPAPAGTARLLPTYPDIVEINVHSGFIDIVAERFDAGVRLGETIAQDMVAVRIGPDMRMAVVGSPAYLSGHKPLRTPHDLAKHNCINLRFPTRGGLYAWEFEKGGRALNVRVEGQLIVNDIALSLEAALDGLGLAYLPEDYVQPDVEARRLTRVLKSWCASFPGYYLYYPSRRQQSPAFTLLVEALRYWG